MDKPHWMWKDAFADLFVWVNRCKSSPSGMSNLLPRSYAISPRPGRKRSRLSGMPPMSESRPRPSRSCNAEQSSVAE